MLRTHHHTTGLSASRAAPTTWPIMAALRTSYDALRDGLVAYRQYEHLRSRGVSHDTAIRTALDIGPSPSRTTCRRAKPLGFAGKG